VTPSDVQAWLDQYVDAWRSNEPGKIGALFTDDAVYAFDPFEMETRPLRGRDVIVAEWLEQPDAPDSWECQYRPLLVDGNLAVATGWTRYKASTTRPAREYRNLFVIRFDGQRRCREFTEWFMEPKAQRAVI
jgi:ketosteroid isomerase-like protein